jgi:pimeloyl-ACP methyl ester carboxylesterase
LVLGGSGHFDPYRSFVADNAQAASVTGKALDCGHFLQDENPDDLLTELRQFLS